MVIAMPPNDEHVYLQKCRQRKVSNEQKIHACILHYMQEIRTRYNTENDLIILSFFSCTKL